MEAFIFKPDLNGGMNSSCYYIRHFNLIENPFADSCGPRFIWLGEKQLENLAYLKVGVEERKGVLLLTGEKGSGKSILVDRLPALIEGDLRTGVVRGEGQPIGIFFDQLIDAFGFGRASATKGDFLIKFQSFLKSEHAAGRRLLLVLEDAQRHEEEILFQAHLFSNMEENGEKLINILLVGSSQLFDRLTSHSLRGLFQRCAVRRHAEPLSLAETGDYIRHRLMAAGSFIEVFTPKAVALIQGLSGGLPPRINRICEDALIKGSLAGLLRIDEKTLTTYTRPIQENLKPGEKVKRIFLKFLK